MAKVLGEKVGLQDRPLPEILDTFANPGVDLVEFETSEVTSLCPVTGQPDFATVSIAYIPKKVCIESKSLKLFLQSYRNEKCFMESLAQRIHTGLYLVLNPVSLKVTVKCTPRGGITLKATVEEVYETKS